MAGTIRSQILLAFLVMTAITGIIGLHASYRIEHGGALVTETYDGSLMAINYARAASADFALMQVAAARHAQALDERSRGELEARLAGLGRSLAEDLEIAAERSQSARAAQTAMRARAAVTAWDEARRQKADPPAESVIDGYVRVADREMDLLINYTAGDGFSYRQHARAAVSDDWWLNLSGLAAAVVLSAAVAWMLARHIVRQVAVASDVASRIALGQLDGAMPEGGQDELGVLLNSLATMRENLRGMMQREVAQRRSAQGRLLDAMESSHEGIVVVNRDGRVVLANDQALSALEWRDETALTSATLSVTRAVAGEKWSRLSAWLPTPEAQGEVAMPGGRWLNISRSATREGGFVAVMSDITALKEQGARLAATNLRLDTALDNMSQGLCLFDADGRLTVVNACYSEIFGLPPDRVRLGLSILELIAMRVEHGNHPGATVESLVLAKMAAVGRRVPTTCTMPIAGGRILSVSMRPAPNGGWAATYEDVTERRVAEEKVVFMARHDALTRLPNRTLFIERMQQALMGLDQGRTFAVLCLDLDRFKEVNDTLGHAMGDVLLRTVSERLQSCVRATDTVSRGGGDEFTIIQVAPQSAEEIEALARRIIEVTSEPYDLEGRRATIGISIGISVARGDGMTADALLRNADMALYCAKEDGRGTWRFFEPEMDANIRARRALGNDLRDALARGEFELLYQPVCGLKHERVGAFEALLRWRHPVRGIVPPLEFIPIAEEMGLIVPLGEWVLQQACLEAARWPDHVSVAVNVSSAQFRTDQLVQTVMAALQSARLPARRLSLEITETVLLSHGQATLATMQALRAMGVRISLDDFGTGYSSLSYLGTFPIDQIKIDQSFVRNLTETNTGAVVRAIIGLAASLSMRVVAEGVETMDQVRWLRSERCDDVQGFFLAQPLAPSELPDAIDRRLWFTGDVDELEAAGLERHEFNIAP
jgi:diguanylate cyclase (GGDEF)-like protein